MIVTVDCMIYAFRFYIYLHTKNVSIWFTESVEGEADNVF